MSKNLISGEELSSKNIIVIGEPDPVYVPPVVPLALNEDNFSEYVSGLGSVPSVDTLLGVKDGVVKSISAENSFKVSVQPIAIGDFSPVGYICQIPIDNDQAGLITGISEDSSFFNAIIFGVALAKVDDSVEINDVLYNVSTDTPGYYELIRKSSAAVGERTLGPYPLAIALEPSTNGFAKVFFFGGLSIAFYAMAAEVALNNQ